MTNRCPDQLAHLEPDAQLFPVERKVAQLVACGLTNPTIAGALAHSRHTVATHLGRMLRKTGARNRGELVIWMYETGHLTPGRTGLFDVSPLSAPARGGAVSDRRNGLNLNAALPHDLIDTAWLMACGLTNPAIGARLHRSYDVINYWLLRLRNITGSRTRVQIIVWMYETGRIRPGTPSLHQPVIGTPPTPRNPEALAIPEMPSEVRIRAYVLLARPERADWLLIRDHGDTTWHLPGRDVTTAFYTPSETVLSTISDTLGLTSRTTPRFRTHTWTRIATSTPLLTYLFDLGTVSPDLLQPRDGVQLNWVHHALTPPLLPDGEAAAVNHFLGHPEQAPASGPYEELVR